MACGLKVVLWNGEIINKLPEENNPFRVAKKLWSLYQEIL
jgi:hypothetical protein